MRAAAIARVYLHHTLWIGWLTVVFPSMFVMFALAGYLTAVSLDRGGAAKTLWSRARRLLPPLWGLAAIAVPIMLLQGWAELHWSGVLYWLVPLANPPTNEISGAFGLALWYIRAYLWFILLAPLLWWAFKRWPVITLAIPLAGAVALHTFLPVPMGHPAVEVLYSTTFYGTAWVLGYARHSGLLERLSWKLYGATAVVLGAGGLAWGLIAGSLENPVAQIFWSTGFVLALMRLRPTMAWLDNLPPLKKLITFINARAVTIYVWHLPVLFAAGTIVSRLGLDPIHNGAGKTIAIVLGTCLLCVAVMGTGWIEDLAARRRPALLPATR